MLRIGDIEFFDNVANIIFENSSRAEITKHSGEDCYAAVTITFYSPGGENITEDIDALVDLPISYLSDDCECITTDNISAVLEYLSAAG